jgi:uncharacterized protein
MLVLKLYDNGVIFMAYRPIEADEIYEKALPIFNKYKIKKAALFGSSARGEMRRGSDIDLIVELDETQSGLVFIEIKRKLQNKLNRKVDLITYKSLAYSDLEDSILEDAKVIYEKAH